MSFKNIKNNVYENRVTSLSDSSPDELSDESPDKLSKESQTSENERKEREEKIKNEKINDMLNRMSVKSKQPNSEKKQTSKVLNYDEIEFDKLEENDRKTLKDLFLGLPDIYKITGTTPEDSQTTINKKCAEKLKMYHPDRHSELVKKFPEENRAKELKKLDIQFKLLRDADSILRDPTKRKYYDLQKKTVESKNYVSQKESFDEFIKLQNSKITEQSRSIAENDFKMASLAMDQKHKFDRKSGIDRTEAALTVEETERRFSDLELGRTQDEIEFIPKNRFDTREFSNADFNKMFLRQKQKEAMKKGKHGTDTSVIVWEGISAANDTGIDGATNYISVDHNYEDLYTDNNFNGSSMYASKLDDFESEESIGSDSDFDMGEDVNLDELDGYKYNKENVNSKYEEMLNRRNMENQAYDNRKVHDKESWKSIMENPFTISASLGNVVGDKDFNKIEGPKRVKAISQEYADVYKSLVYENNESTTKKKHKHKKDKDSKNREKTSSKHLLNDEDI